MIMSLLSRIPLVGRAISEYYRWRYYRNNLIPPGETHTFIAQSPVSLFVHEMKAVTIPENAESISLKPVQGFDKPSTWFEVHVSNDSDRKVCVQLIAIGRDGNLQRFVAFNNATRHP